MTNSHEPLLYHFQCHVMHASVPKAQDRWRHAKGRRRYSLLLHGDSIVYTPFKPLKDAGPQYTTKYTIYMVAIKFMNRIWSIYGFKVFFNELSYVKKKIDICLYLTLMIKIHSMYLHALKVVWFMHLFNPRQHQGVQPFSKSWFQIWVTFW